MKRNLAIQILCSLFLLIGAGNICQAQESEGKFRIHCAVFVLFSSSCMHVCRPNGRKRRKENSLSHMPSLLRQWKKETIWLMVYYMTLKENPVIYQNCKADTSCWISGVSTAALAACLNRKWKRLPIYMAINWPW